MASFRCFLLLCRIAHQNGSGFYSLVFLSHPSLGPLRKINKDRFEEGEFQKRVQFMFGGKLERVKFRYTGPSVEAVLDRLPTAKIVEKCGDGYIMEAEVFGKGIEMWLRSQGSHVERIP